MAHCINQRIQRAWTCMYSIYLAWITGKEHRVLKKLGENYQLIFANWIKLCQSALDEIMHWHIISCTRSYQDLGSHAFANECLVKPDMSFNLEFHLLMQKAPPCTSCLFFSPSFWMWLSLFNLFVFMYAPFY